MEQKYKIEINEDFKNNLYKELISELPKHDNNYTYRLEEIKKAYEFAFEAHKKQRRKGGDKDPFIIHPVAVAKIVACEMGLGTTTVVSALLHDVVEDTHHTIEEIEAMFGKKVSIIVEGVTKITKMSGKKESYQLETFKKLIFTIPKDHRVILVKIADRLHNMRTMDDMPDNSRQIKSSENLFIYAPIANIVGMRDIKNQIEDHSFKYLHLPEYERMREMEKKYSKRKNLIFEKLKLDLQKMFQPNYLDFEFFRVKKSLYSAWIKTKKKNNKLCSVHNFYSTRITIGAYNDDKKRIRQIAYDVFQQITDKYQLKLNSLQDWIKNPKNNGFSALIFDIIDKNGNIFEIQIMSRKGHDIANKGFLPISKSLPIGFNFITAGIDIENDAESFNDEIVDIVRHSINPTRITVYTPNGERIELAKGSTALDFAFKIHSDLGMHCIGVKIDEQRELFPPSYILKNTEKVEILTKNDKKPKEEWLDFVVTSNAQKHIKSYFRKKEEATAIDKIEKSKEVKISKKEPLVIDGSFKYFQNECCNPIPGDESIAFQNALGRVIVHKKNCKETTLLRATYGDKTTTVIWKPFKNNAILTKISLKGDDRIGIMTNLMRVISEELNINMKELHIKADKGIFKGKIHLYVFNIEQLGSLISKLSKIEGMFEVERME